jgi:hypothetical protein
LPSNEIICLFIFLFNFSLTLYLKVNISNLNIIYGCGSKVETKCDSSVVYSTEISFIKFLEYKKMEKNVQALPNNVQMTLCCNADNCNSNYLATSKKIKTAFKFSPFIPKVI